MISDESGQKVHAKKGDVFFFQKGAKIKFEIPDGIEGALAFYCGQVCFSSLSPFSRM